ncbi:D-alanyl-D-alanine carboxypeptidase/D-alanyl-D-alanine-endopeptidase [Actibacterium sp.]|uniref:D-alanyl-D-alanine carboxypeptidase/D-alanyl-D-alanine endopeptidase n=1 Tax=Actibacterium sp. TaxID=1872125 RepID=UPI003561F984
MVTRRFVLAGLGAGLVAGPVSAEPLARSIPPRARPAREITATAPEIESLIATSRLTGDVGFVVADARTGEVLESRNPLLALPPASTAKVITTLYALEHLGPDHRFQTRLVATGPIANGRLAGDLILLGGGDPVLDTDDLGDLVADLHATGLRSISGQFLYDPRALPQLTAIDSEQPEYVSYNPAVSGLNLNFNRVYFEWKRGGAGWDVALDARALRYRPEVHTARMRIVDRNLPVYTYARSDGVDDWTVASAALGKGGGRWLPVRDPGAYTAEVMQTLAGATGLTLPRPQPATGEVTGTVLARHNSADLTTILHGMLKFSTNLTAESVGLAATRARGTSPQSLEQSATQMQGWLETTLTPQKARFFDHSGLSDRSHMAAADMVQALVRSGPDGALAKLMKEIPMRDPAGRAAPDHPAKVHAKTGTLNFVSALAGYISQPGKRDLAFTFFSADQAHRAKLRPDQREHPEGGRAWTSRSRLLQGRLLDRWATLYQA